MAGVHIDRSALDNAVFGRTGGHVTRYFERKGGVVIRLGRANLARRPRSTRVVPGRGGQIGTTAGPLSSGTWNAQITGTVKTRGLLVTFDHPLANIVHDGTSPHAIRPVVARRLRWPEPSGAWVSATAVLHPGQQAYPFLRDALYAAFTSDL